MRILVAIFAAALLSSTAGTVQAADAATPAAPAIPTGAAVSPVADDGAAEDHLGIGDAALGIAFLVGGVAFGTVTMLRRRRKGNRD